LSFGDNAKNLIVGAFIFFSEKRIEGIEPSSSAWKADNLPLVHIRLQCFHLIEGSASNIPSKKVYKKRLTDISKPQDTLSSSLIPSL